VVGKRFVRGYKDQSEGVVVCIILNRNAYYDVTRWW